MKTLGMRKVPAFPHSLTVHEENQNSELDQEGRAGRRAYSLYFAVVVSVSNTVTSFTRTRPFVTLRNRVFDSS
jgi:hypothetical protein